ncbi:hypothetical protein ACQP1U_13735 [Actinomycetota bacterium]
MTRTERGGVKRNGVRAHRGLERRDVVTVGGIAVVGLEDTWVDLGEVLSVDELIIVGDAIATRREGVESLAARLESRGPVRGRARLRAALPQIRCGSRSAKETETRLVIVRGGLSEPELNAAVIDQEGTFLGLGDLVWEEEEVVGEYQGRDHFRPERSATDIVRRMDYERAGWRMVEITAAMIAGIPAQRRFLLHLADKLQQQDRLRLP